MTDLMPQNSGRRLPLKGTVDQEDDASGVRIIPPSTATLVVGDEVIPLSFESMTSLDQFRLRELIDA